MKHTRKLAFSALLVSIMIALGYLESLLPVSPVPGIKLGLSNSVLIIALFWLGIPTSFQIMLVKNVLLGLLLGNPMMIPYSLCGGIASLALMSLLYKRRGITPIGVGIAGGVMHNIGQVTLAMVILQTPSLIFYLGLLMPAGAAMGFITGTVAKTLAKHFPPLKKPGYSTQHINGGEINVKKQAWLILCIIALVAGLALAATNMVTAGPIEEQSLKATREARIAVFPDASDFTEMDIAEDTGLDSIYEAKLNGDTIGYVLQNTVSGYGGPIEIVIGIDTQGMVTGLSVGGSSFAETAGLGTQVKEPAFTDQFVGLAELPVLNGNVDTISGATISSSAVINGIIQCYKQWEIIAGGGSSDTAAAPSAAVPLEEDGVFIGEADGFVAPIRVSVTVENGYITAIKVLEQNDTEAMFAMAQDGIIPAVLQANGTDGVDTVSGATYSSQGLLDAIADALCRDCAETADTQALPTQYTDGVYIGEAQGYMGKIQVSVTITDGSITAVKVLEYSDDTAIFAMARDSIVPAVIAANSAANVDTVSGATYSSNGLLDAIANALLGTPVQTEAEENAPFEDGVFIGEAQGYSGKIRVSVTVEDNRITAIKVLDQNDSEALFAMARESILPAVIAANTTEGMDTVSGATYSSQGLLDAIAEALCSECAETADIPSIMETHPDGIFVGEAQGYTGKVEVAVSITDGVITAVQVLNQSDTDAIFAMAKDSIIPAVLAANSVSGVDTVSGATYSSRGLLDAILNAISKPVPMEYAYTDGTYQGEGEGYHGAITVSVTIANGSIAEIELLESADNQTIVTTLTDTLFPLVLESNTTDGVDAIADATYSSQGLLAAITDALSQAAVTE